MKITIEIPDQAIAVAISKLKQLGYEPIGSTEQFAAQFIQVTLMGCAHPDSITNWLTLDMEGAIDDLVEEQVIRATA